MTFQDQIAADLAGVIDSGEISVEITYTPKDGEAVTINAIALPEDVTTDDDEQGQTKINHRDFVILTDPDKGIASPKPDDVITYGELDRRVTSVDSKTLGKARLSTVAPETHSKHHEMHKKTVS